MLCLKNYTELFELDGLDVEAFCLEKTLEIYIFRPQISFIINLIILIIL